MKTQSYILAEFDDLTGLTEFPSPKKKHRIDMDPLQEQILREVHAEQRKSAFIFRL